MKDKIEEILNRHKWSSDFSSTIFSNDRLDTAIKELSTLISQAEKEAVEGFAKEIVGQLPAFPKGRMIKDIEFWLNLISRAKQIQLAKYLQDREKKAIKRFGNFVKKKYCLNNPTIVTDWNCEEGISLKELIKEYLQTLKEDK